MKINTINKEIGSRIKIARISRNLGQDSIAEDLGISVAAYSNMERGVIDITFVRIIKVAEILKIQWIYLLGISEIKEVGFEESLQILSAPRTRYNSYNAQKTSNLEKEIELLKKEIGKLKVKKK